MHSYFDLDWSTLSAQQQGPAEKTSCEHHRAAAEGNQSQACTEAKSPLWSRITEERLQENEVMTITGRLHPEE